MAQRTIGVVIPTWNSSKHLPLCLPPLLRSPLKPRVLVIDSSSEDGTLEVARHLGAEALMIPQSTFNHGLTREKARKHLATDIVVMVTPDAYAVDKESLGKLVRPVAEGHAMASYGRQLPHKGAGFFEAFPREFNYPPQSHMRCLADKVKLGRYAFFCSNSFAAYSSKALDEIGGFQKVLLGEDTVAVAQLLRRGYRVAYVAEATVHHSHSYSLWQEFKRYFDTGLARKEYDNLLQCASTDTERGTAFAKTMLKILLKRKPYLLPYAFLHLTAKWGGYSLGQMGHSFPGPIKRLLSAHPDQLRDDS